MSPSPFSYNNQSSFSVKKNIKDYDPVKSANKHKKIVKKDTNLTGPGKYLKI